ncbi:ubiquitin carboxyl-terminal hydrolase 2-like [Phragmites australis]|uniref:ubiquitin carboxyl-terminal hydrolase 2-like n=1 Tax=Phragmites australis TaxID=29695 RepID=UPI002D796DBF|nr:ubiquitin carboxyl-terminal hydrolase 2-like [Phragmites australis]XP_062196785.1 ubiquitin carboxyl-terminal hydrolase 2-like [Phragmites australis]
MLGYSDSTEAQRIWQSKDAIQGSLQAQEDKISCSKLSQGIIEAPHNMSDVKVEQMIETTTDSHSQEDMDPPPLVAPLSENNARMASGSNVDQNDNADPGDLFNQPEVSIEAEENTYTVQVIAEDKGNSWSRDIVCDKEVGDSNSVPSIEDCLSVFFEEQVIERRCDDCPKVPEKPSTNQSQNSEHMVASTHENTTADGDQTEQSDRTACQNEQSGEPNSLSVECKASSSRQPHSSDAEGEIIQTADTNTEGTNSWMSCGEKDSSACSTTNKKPERREGIQEAISSCLPAEKQANLLSTQHSQNLSTPNQDRRKRVWLDVSLSQLKDNQNEQRDRSGCAIQTARITKLPPVLTLHLKRYIQGDNLHHHKNEAHVSYKEYLDVGRFMDPSSVDKDNPIYRLVGVVEHRGPSLDAGHYVAYVRARRLGNHQLQSSCSSSWFCANDSNISEVTLEEVLKCEAYVLFYERMEGHDTSGKRSHI